MHGDAYVRIIGSGFPRNQDVITTLHDAGNMNVVIRYEFRDATEELDAWLHPGQLCPAHIDQAEIISQQLLDRSKIAGVAGLYEGSHSPDRRITAPSKH